MTVEDKAILQCFAPKQGSRGFCRRVRTFGITRDKDPKPTFHHRQHVATRAHRVNRLCRREKCVITSMLHSFKTYWLLALIKTFLSTFKCQDKDITSGFADIDIEDEQNASTSETRDLKYLNQLVR